MATESLSNRVLLAICGITVPLILPLQTVSTLVLGLAAMLTCGLLLIPISLVWLACLLPMLGVTWLCDQRPILREIVGFAGLPLILLVHLFVCLMPSMGELENRAVKLMLCYSWPLTWAVWRYFQGDSNRYFQIAPMLDRITDGNPIAQQALRKIELGRPLDSGL